MKNSVGPDQKQADQDLHCFQKRDYHFEKAMEIVRLLSQIRHTS